MTAMELKVLLKVGPRQVLQGLWEQNLLKREWLNGTLVYLSPQRAENVNNGPGVGNRRPQRRSGRKGRRTMSSMLHWIGSMGCSTNASDAGVVETW